MKQPTHFASSERSSPKEIGLSFGKISSQKQILEILGAISGIAAILDENRQIVYANDDLLDVFGISSIEMVLGKRPGEAVGCIHASENTGGCGTSEACAVCGAVNAILESQETGIKSTKETRIFSESDNKQKSWDFKVTSAPILINGKKFYVFTLLDISDEKRRQSLERIFFHDVLNSAGGLNGLLQILNEGADPGEERELIKLSAEASRDLVDEIMIHRQIRSAEKGDLKVSFEYYSSDELLKSAVSRVSRYEIAKEKKILITDYSTGSFVFTDRIIVMRVLVNMLKNAIEATEPNGTIYASAIDFPDIVRFQIKNDSIMQKKVQMQVFQRSFTTKGKGRGIGTYSIKLLTEMYLHGKTGFKSNESEGTIFFIDIFKKAV